jgi:hypothetical protein
MEKKIFKMKNLVLIAMCIALVGLASAAISDLGVFQQQECVNLYQMCDNCTYVNISSVTFPNSTIDTIEAQMTKNGVDYNYTYCQTVDLGEYLYKVCGDKDGTFECEVIKFSVTPTGDERGFGMFLVLIIFAVSCFIISLSADIEFLTFFSGILFLLSGIYAMIYGVGDLADLYTRGIAAVSLGMGLVFIVASVYNLTKHGEY